jgi:hypothetical protein
MASLFADTAAAIGAGAARLRVGAATRADPFKAAVRTALETTAARDAYLETGSTDARVAHAGAAVRSICAWIPGDQAEQADAFKT